jgi:hypothetical protein
VSAVASTLAKPAVPHGVRAAAGTGIRIVVMGCEVCGGTGGYYRKPDRVFVPCPKGCKAPARSLAAPRSRRVLPPATAGDAWMTGGCLACMCPCSKRYCTCGCGACCPWPDTLPAVTGGRTATVLRALSYTGGAW